MIGLAIVVIFGVTAITVQIANSKSGLKVGVLALQILFMLYIIAEYRGS